MNKLCNLPPDHLSTAAKSWWLSVNENFQLEPHHFKLLQLCCEAWDQAAIARTIIACCGFTFDDKWGQPRSRPEIAIEQQARRDFARLLRELGLESSAPPDAGLPRPPALKK